LAGRFGKGGKPSYNLLSQVVCPLVCPSPILQNAKELKFVVDDVLSIEVLLKAQFRNSLEEGNVILQPEGNKTIFFERALGLQRELSELGFTVRVLPQLHKLFGLP
jgi:organic radical activating enzyme